MNLNIILFTSLLLFPLVSYSAPDKVIPLQPLQAAWEEETKKIDDATDEVRRQCLSRYARAVAAIIDAAKQEGDFDAYDAAKAEEKRLQDERNVPDTSPADLSLSIQAARAAYRDSVSEAEANSREKIALLQKSYVSLLESLKKVLMILDRIEEAREVQAALTTYESVTADAESKMPKSETTATATAPAQPGEPARVEEWREGLVLYLPFDEDEGKAVSDASPAGNKGVVHGALWTEEGKRGGGCEFGGADDWIEVPHSDSLNLASQMTLAAWIKTVLPTGREPAIISKAGSYMLYSHRRQACASIVTSEGQTDVAERGQLAERKWYHLASVYDGERLTLYLDGTPVRMLATTGELAQNKKFVQIGKRHYAERNFGGVIDEVTIHNRALSPSEISELYDATGR